PFALIGRLLTKVRRDRARMILVALVWPAQPWWPDLLEMTQGKRLELKARQGVFFSQWDIEPPNWKTIASTATEEHQTKRRFRSCGHIIRQLLSWDLTRSSGTMSCVKRWRL